LKFITKTITTILTVLSQCQFTKNSSRPPTGTDECVSHLQRVRECMFGNFAGINSLYSQLQGDTGIYGVPENISYRGSADGPPDTKFFQALHILPYPPVTDCITNSVNPFVVRKLNVNCQSIKNKKHQIQNPAYSTKPDVIIATETWLDPTITNSQIFPPNYNIYRKDRTGNKIGGGVLIPINDKYLSSEIPEVDTECEIIWCNIQQKG
jgi:hypothetical protein